MKKEVLTVKREDLKKVRIPVPQKPPSVMEDKTKYKRKPKHRKVDHGS